MKLEYILVYGNHNEIIDSKIINFWRLENSLHDTTDYALEKRLSEVIYIVTIDSKIVAVSSCGLVFVNELRGNFLYYRSFVGQNYRNNNIAENLLQVVYEYFNPLRTFNLEDIKGIYIIFENELLNKYVRKYQHPFGGTLLGFDENKNQIRVKYFADSEF
jgi:hypothetical protein